MKKGQKKRIWTKEDKLKIVKRYSTEHISAKELGRIYEADYSMICRWIREYAAEGDKAFEKGKAGTNMPHCIQVKIYPKSND